MLCIELLSVCKGEYNMFHLLVKTDTKNQKRRGRGWGSGRGKNSGRGMKGQKKRGKVRANFIGGALVLSKRLPMLRGKGKNKSIKKVTAVNIERIETSGFFAKKCEVTVPTLVKAGLISATTAKSHQVKLLGRGTLTKCITTSLLTTKKAVEKIKNAGGQLT